MVNASVSPKLTRAGNELGAPTTYQLFLEREGVPALGGFLIEDINHVRCRPGRGWAGAACI